MPNELSTRRHVIAAASAGLGALLSARSVFAQAAPPTKPAEPPKPGPKPAEPGKPAAPHAGHDHGAGAATKEPPPLPLASVSNIIETTSLCQREGDNCLARCTEHLSAGDVAMAACQRSTMNMLAVTSAMGKVASYRNSSPKLIKSLTTACAQFCRACASACEPHKDHHEECKTCMEACLACAKACDAFTA
jgi:Cys-rich four helix bundle protein (predicted Tat secretion target)